MFNAQMKNLNSILKYNNSITKEFIWKENCIYVRI